ncbi:HAD hydrolase-like protein, partial [Streptomyces rubiginosohelvolus]|uniref:HAD family hydrolase n=1 Tax=Streptomyces rubiginosohelvolus TaxID=67362 RepID=UPI0034049194
SSRIGSVGGRRLDGLLGRLFGTFRRGLAGGLAEFFHRVAAVVPADPDEILYVGDRVDNDLRPGAAAGMHTALIHRGPWATIQWHTEEAEKLPTFRVESLLELSPLIARFNEREH